MTLEHALPVLSVFLAKPVNDAARCAWSSVPVAAVFSAAGMLAQMSFVNAAALQLDGVAFVGAWLGSEDGHLFIVGWHLAWSFE